MDDREGLLTNLAPLYSGYPRIWMTITHTISLCKGFDLQVCYNLGWHWGTFRQTKRMGTVETVQVLPL